MPVSPWQSSASDTTGWTLAVKLAALLLRLQQLQQAEPLGTWLRSCARQGRAFCKATQCQASTECRRRRRRTHLLGRARSGTMPSCGGVACDRKRAAEFGDRREKQASKQANKRGCRSGCELCHPSERTRANHRTSRSVLRDDKLRREYTHRPDCSFEHALELGLQAAATSQPRNRAQTHTRAYGAPVWVIGACRSGAGSCAAGVHCEVATGRGMFSACIGPAVAGARPLTPKHVCECMQACTRASAATHCAQASTAPLQALCLIVYVLRVSRSRLRALLVHPQQRPHFSCWATAHHYAPSLSHEVQQ